MSYLQAERLERHRVACTGLGKEIAKFYYPNWFKCKRYFKKGKQVVCVDTRNGRGSEIITHKKAVPTKIKGMTGGWL